MKFVSIADVAANETISLTRTISASVKWQKSMSSLCGSSSSTKIKVLLNPKREAAPRLYTGRGRVRLKLTLFGWKVGFSLLDVKRMIDLYDPTVTNAKQLRLTLDKSDK